MEQLDDAKNGIKILNEKYEETQQMLFDARKDVIRLEETNSSLKDQVRRFV